VKNLREAFVGMANASLHPTAEKDDVFKRNFFVPAERGNGGYARPKQEGEPTVTEEDRREMTSYLIPELLAHAGGLLEVWNTQLQPPPKPTVLTETNIKSFIGSDELFYSREFKEGKMFVVYEMFVNGKIFSQKVSESPIQITTNFDKLKTPEVAMIETCEDGQFIVHMYADQDFMETYQKMYVHWAADFKSFRRAHSRPAKFKQIGNGLYEDIIHLGSRPMEVILGNFEHGRDLYEPEGNTYVRMVIDWDEHVRPAPKPQRLTRVQLYDFAVRVRDFGERNNRWPTDAEVAQLGFQDRWGNSPYIELGFVNARPKGHYFFNTFSSGPDGVKGTEDDKLLQGTNPAPLNLKHRER